MKRHGNLFARAFTKEALLQAYHDAARSKRGKRACFTFERSLGAQLAALHTELHGGTYEVRPYFAFTIHEPKTRRIFAPAFRDCVVQHAIYRLISPIFEATFIDQSFACRVGYGTHKAADYAEAALQNSPEGSYTLQLDIRKFFYRIDRAILRTQIERKIKDRRFVELMMAFTDHGEPVGIPIGNLLSQLYALVYLNPLDHFVKRVLKVKHYCRYVDDFVLFGLTRERAVECRRRIISFIDETLHLKLSRSTIAPRRRGLNFVGYRTWGSRRFIRRRSLYNFRQALKKGKVNSLVSILGHARRTHSLRHLINTIKEKNHAIYCQLPKIYQRPHHYHPARSGGDGPAQYHRAVYAGRQHLCLGA
jgi:RNA-directed DNA polymerase